MRVLLDTHVLLWAAADDARLSEVARSVLEDTNVDTWWSAASTWELSIKAAVGKLTLPEPAGAYVESRLLMRGVTALPIAHTHAAAVEGLPMHHRDPFDRMLVVQAQCEGLTLLSSDPLLIPYGVPILW